MTNNKKKSPNLLKNKNYVPKKSCLVKKTTKQNNYHSYSQRNPIYIYIYIYWEWQHAQKKEKKKKMIDRGNVPRKGKEEKKKKKMAEATCLGKKKNGRGNVQMHIVIFCPFSLQFSLNFRKKTFC